MWWCIFCQILVTSWNLWCHHAVISFSSLSLTLSHTHHVSLAGKCVKWLIQLMFQLIPSKKNVVTKWLGFWGMKSLYNRHTDSSKVKSVIKENFRVVKQNHRSAIRRIINIHMFTILNKTAFRSNRYTVYHQTLSWNISILCFNMLHIFADLLFNTFLWLYSHTFATKFIHLRSSWFKLCYSFQQTESATEEKNCTLQEALTECKARIK